MQKTLTYFAYGSNMSSRRLKARIPSARVVGTGHLPGHRLAFHKFSHVDLSAKCDAHPSGDPEDRVYGVIYSIAAIEKPRLDSVEGVGNGYEEKEVLVQTEAGTVRAFTYAATRIDPSLKPYLWYKEHVLRGAREHGLAPDYLGFLNAVQAIPDPDRERHFRELSIYDSSS